MVQQMLADLTQTVSDDAIDERELIEGLQVVAKVTGLCAELSVQADSERAAGRLLRAGPRHRRQAVRTSCRRGAAVGRPARARGGRGVRLEPEAHRHAQRVEPRAEVGRGRGDADEAAATPAVSAQGVTAVGSAPSVTRHCDSRWKCDSSSSRIRARASALCR